jgi:hypothetical protein
MLYNNLGVSAVRSGAALPYGSESGTIEVMRLQVRNLFFSYGKLKKKE